MSTYVHHGPAGADNIIDEMRRALGAAICGLCPKSCAPYDAQAGRIVDVALAALEADEDARDRAIQERDQAIADRDRLAAHADVLDSALRAVRAGGTR